MDLFLKVVKNFFDYYVNDRRRHVFSQSGEQSVIATWEERNQYILCLLHKQSPAASGPEPRRYKAGIAASNAKAYACKP